MATRFWVGGTGTWDASDTTHWAATTGGAGGQSVPGSSDTVTFDGASGGGTVTPASTAITVQSIACGAFTGTLAFNTNDPNVTLSAVAGMNLSGTGTRTINLGDGIWDLTSATAGTIWNAATVTGLTFNANGSTIRFSTNSTGIRNFSGGGLTYNILDISANTSLGCVVILGSNTFATISMTAPTILGIGNGLTQTITNAFNWDGNSTNKISVIANGLATISTASGTPLLDWGYIRGVACTGGATFSATNTVDLGSNTGISISAPTPAAASYLLQINS
jgi:hypothetical protein